MTGASLPHALDMSTGAATVTTVADGFDKPWAFGFLPDGGVVVTERNGRVILLDGEKRRKLDGVGPVAVRGQGGLMDVLVPRDFARTRTLFFTLAKQQERGEGTAVARAHLSPDAARLQSWTVIFEMTEGSSGGRHFGSRLVEGPDGLLYFTVGDRGDGPTAQDLGRENGSVLRISRKGTAPADNPFTKEQGARPAIWSWGHRNPQGMAFGPDGQLWVVEHGARGGDEVNRITKGANYGWPVISYGRHYSGRTIGDGTSKSGLEQPAHYWDPSIAPSGMMIYSGALWPEWKGAIFVGSLKFNYIARLSGAPLTETEQIRSEETVRVRDIREGPDGAIWFLSEGNGALYRIAP